MDGKGTVSSTARARSPDAAGRGDGASRIAAGGVAGTLIAAGLVAAAALLGGCVVYEPVPVGYTRPASFDRSFNAAAAAMREQGVAITQEDRGAGVVRGVRGGIDVTGTVRTQADGSVRVQFDTSGATASDPTLIDRITRSYNAYMGR